MGISTLFLGISTLFFEAEFGFFYKKMQKKVFSRACEKLAITGFYQKNVKKS